jgi:hypothetical protein
MMDAQLKKLWQPLAIVAALLFVYAGILKKLVVAGRKLFTRAAYSFRYRIHNMGETGASSSDRNSPVSCLRRSHVSLCFVISVGGDSRRRTFHTTNIFGHNDNGFDCLFFGVATF